MIAFSAIAELFLFQTQWSGQYLDKLNDEYNSVSLINSFKFKASENVQLSSIETWRWRTEEADALNAPARALVWAVDSFRFDYDPARARV